MAVLAAIRTPNSTDAPDSAPRRIVAALPDVEIDVSHFERDGGTAVPYFWMRGVSEEALESAVAADPALTGLERLDRADGIALYKASWAVDSPLIECVAAANGKVVEARGTPPEWELKLWFETGADASAFHAGCRTRAIPLTIDKLQPFADAVTEPALGLSSPQREALTLAYESGYFETPRRTSQEELAATLGISSSAVGGRLRRGFAALVEATLMA